MYKHECVQCLKTHHLRCIYNISFIDRFFGTKNIIYCPEYLSIINYNNRIEGKNRRKQK
jgi:hypothetical protein